MGVYWIPISISEQLEVVQLLQKVPFIPHEQIDFLVDIEKILKQTCA
ncbi:hypothetical protein HQ489_00460 [Candidatus Woesearchaeota archaeon]|nr:hypothetical protein [Candidatus Woesearchaeota archaeon]